jgi:hypothetical protein
MATWQATAGTARRLIEERVAERARRVTAEQVQETCSFARAERLLGREYHGRFLIELLQNAADAWRSDARSGRSQARVVVAEEGPALLVANRGTPFPASAVVESLGHIGRSTKAHGEAIGHKGIGFKSVLEVTLTPELYSGLQDDGTGVAIRFDPESALQLIRGSSPEWDVHLEAIDDIHDPLAAVPVLRYPMWVDRLPAAVRALADAGFDTVVRLPFSNHLRPAPDMDRMAWLRVVHAAIDSLSDETLLLLGTFERLEVVDTLEDHERVIEPRWGEPSRMSADVTRERVTVLHDGAPGSRWRLYRRQLPDSPNLAGEIAVGLRSAVGDAALVPAVSGTMSAPFHLFFPTKIGSGLPFLLHGYFEVNAARTGFYDGSAAQNDAMLGALAELVAAAVEDTARDAPTALMPLADLLGRAPAPEDPHAAAFRDRARSLLDEVAWVPLEPDRDVPECGKPTSLLVSAQRELIDRVVGAFAPSYILSRTGRAIPAREIGDAGHRYLTECMPEVAPDLWTALVALCTPGHAGPWPPGEEDQRFLALLDLLSALAAVNSTRAEQLLTALRGDPTSCVLPATASDGGRTMLPVPDPGEAVSGRPGVLVMARARDPGGPPLAPPPELQVAFLPDGLLESEAQVDRAKPLGVRAFTVDNVLERLGGIQVASADPVALLRFLWSLLEREGRSEFSTAAAVELATEFDPAAWFWCRPGHGSISADAERQRRRRLLAQTRLLARDGSWQPALTLAFGSDWADWLTSGACGPLSNSGRARVRAYRALEATSPGNARMLAPPGEVTGILADLVPSTGESHEPADDNVRLHAFLMMLGVWEVFPVEGFESREMAHRPRFPWTGPVPDARREQIEAAGGWTFEQNRWSGGQHQNVWAAEDFRFAWNLGAAASRDAERTAELLSTGAPLYSRLGHLAVFCPGCATSGTRHTPRYQSSASDGYPSILAVELQTEAWLPVVLNGARLSEPQVASAAWWTERPPAGAGLRQSPLRFLPLCDRAVELPSDLRRLAGIEQLPTASAARVERLLVDLRSQFDEDALPVALSSSSARTAYAGLHRDAYERLAELSEPGATVASEVLARTGLLCDIGESLDYVDDPGTARHDDGDFASYRRYFAGRIPFVALPRDRAAVAKRLGISPFTVVEQRRPNETSREVTDEVAEFVRDRIPELLAIVAHHSLGTQTLEPGSQQFEERATRLQNLRVYQVDDLVIDVHIEGTDETTTIGEGSDQDLFLEGASTAHPTLYHDFAGEGWKEAFRRKLAPHLAKLLENAAYSATFTLFLLADSDGDREDVLHDLGISSEDVAAIAAGLGAVTEEEQDRHRRWFAAILAAALDRDPPAFDRDGIADALIAAGLPSDAAHRLVEHGGGEAVRGDPNPGGPLWLLAENRLDLGELDRRLRDQDPHDGLTIDVAKKRLIRWVRQNRRWVAAVLSTRRTPAEAKATTEAWRPQPNVRLVLDPTPAQWLAPVIDTLKASGFDPDATALAERPIDELTRLLGASSPVELETRAALVYDPEERARMQRAAAASWRVELALLGVLARTKRGDPRAAVRAQAQLVEELLPVAPDSPEALEPTLGELLTAHGSLADAVARMLGDGFYAQPDRSVLLALSEKHGLEVSHLEAVQTALSGPRRELAQKLRRRITELADHHVKPVAPASLTAAAVTQPSSERRPGPVTIPQVKVTPSSDARKRHIGDEGEQWALAAVLSVFVELEPSERRTAIDAILELLDRFTGSPVDRARARAEAACEPNIDEEELIEELTELLHVSRHSDGFGFDLLAWLAPVAGAAPRAMCLEVKSSSDGSFHMSAGEWNRADWFRYQGDGAAYAVLVVQRSGGAGAPARLDLLADPVHLVESEQLSKRDDGYILGYRPR